MTIENKVKKSNTKQEKCSFCKEVKEVGKELFWCPKIRNRIHIEGHSFYGNWVCLNCCKKTFYKSTYDKHTNTSWCGNCADCDFPIGAIIDVNKHLDCPSTEYSIVRNVMNKGEEYHLAPNIFSRFDYYHFEWRDKRLCLKPRQMIDGIVELVLRYKKLPVRIVIVLEETTTYGPLSWDALRRFYWSQYDIPQHHREEVWMDNAPVVIAPFYLNEKGVNFDKRKEKIIEFIKQKFGK